MTTKPDALRVLVVDDEPDVAQMLCRILLGLGVSQVDTAHSPADALNRLAVRTTDVVFTDLVMPEASGTELLCRARETGCAASFIVVSAYSTIENAVEAVKAGASDFLPKPFEPHDVELALARVRRERSALADAEALRRSLAEQEPALRALLGVSPAMQAIRAWVSTARGVGANVLIEGDTGTGKELVARALHRDGPFVAVNVAAIPHEMVESELFGHRAGAFTGAHRDRKGLFAEADRGTLFLDEVNGMDLSLQAKLLRAIEEKAVRPVGANREVPTQFRLVAAANEPLERLVESGRFRRDLFHRLNVLHVRLPSLIDRRDDIPLLAQSFLERYASAHGRNARRFSRGALDWLASRAWPGNVRQLENYIERVVVFCPPAATQIELDSMTEGEALEAAQADRLFMHPSWTLDHLERQYVRSVLAHTGGNKTRAAQILDIDYKTLLRKLDRESRAETH